MDKINIYFTVIQCHSFVDNVFVDIVRKERYTVRLKPISENDDNVCNSNQ